MLEPDYWRATLDTLVVHKCRLTDACVGGELLPGDDLGGVNSSSLCALHHRGPLCEVRDARRAHECLYCGSKVLARYAVAGWEVLRFFVATESLFDDGMESCAD